MPRQGRNSSQVMKLLVRDGAIIAVATPPTTKTTKSLPKNSDITLKESKGIKTAAPETIMAM